MFAVLSLILLIYCTTSEENQYMQVDRVILRNPTRNLQVVVTFGHPSKTTQEFIIKENQKINLFDVDFVLCKDILSAKRNGEEKTFLSPGSYYINISPTKGTWKSGETFTPFEGKHYPNRN